MRQRLVVPGDGAAQRRVERQPQPVADQRLMDGGMSRRQRQRRGVVEDLAELEVLEPRTADVDLRHRLGDCMWHT